MKMNLKSAGAIVLISAFLPLFNSCKKTDDEQLTHYQSANHRILGTWVLQSTTETITLDYDVTTSNDVNGDTYTFSRDVTESNTFNGSTLTNDFNSTSKEVTKTQAWDDIVNPTISQISTNTVDSVIALDDTQTWGYQVSIYKDYSYNGLYTSYLNQSSPASPYKTAKTNTQITVNGNLTGNSTDTTYVNMDKFVTTDEGTWNWVDAGHNNLDLNISAGVLGGKITSLSSLTLVIEEHDKTTDTNTDYTEADLMSFLTTVDPFNTKAGVITTITTTTRTRIYKETWTKTSSNTMP